MSRHIFKDCDIDYIIKEHFVTLRTIRDIAREFGVTSKVITRIITRQGRIYWTANNWRYGAICLKACIALYYYGIGLRGVSERLDIPIALLTTEFKRQGVKLRTQSEQETIKWSLMTTEQRHHQVKAAHDTERTLSHETLVKMANSRCKKTSIYESIFANDLRARGILFEEQFPIDIYNIDFVIGNIAVEIFGGNWHSYGLHAARFPERSKKIFDSGYALAILCITKPNSFTFNVRSNFIDLLNSINGKKSSVGKYWMVWSTPETIATGSYDEIDVALIKPSTNVRNGKTGRYESVPR